MSRSPRVALGMPAYHRPDTMARTLESLLSQTYKDFAVVITDDRPSPEVQAIVETYRALDDRIQYEANPSRLGMIENWRRAFERSRARCPHSKYFAWVSDHDILHPRWLEALVAALDAHPQVVLAYPGIMRIYKQERRRKSDMGDTVGVVSRTRRLETALTLTTAGNAIYGLFRADALRRAGVFRPVLAPDRQVLCEMAALGQFTQVQEPLWYREVARAFSYGRQRAMFFPGRSPLAHLPADQPAAHGGPGVGPWRARRGPARLRAAGGIRLRPGALLVLQQARPDARRRAVAPGPRTHGVRPMADRRPRHARAAPRAAAVAAARAGLERREGTMKDRRPRDPEAWIRPGLRNTAKAGGRWSFVPMPTSSLLADEVVAAGRTLLGYDRLYGLWQAMRNVANVPGDAAEIGSFRGARLSSSPRGWKP